MPIDAGATSNPSRTLPKLPGAHYFGTKSASYHSDIRTISVPLGYLAACDGCLRGYSHRAWFYGFPTFFLWTNTLVAYDLCSGRRVRSYIIECWLIRPDAKSSELRTQCQTYWWQTSCLRTTRSTEMPHVFTFHNLISMLLDFMRTGVLCLFYTSHLTGHDLHVSLQPWKGAMCHGSGHHNSTLCRTPSAAGARRHQGNHLIFASCSGRYLWKPWQLAGAGVHCAFPFDQSWIFIVFQISTYVPRVKFSKSST